MDLTISLQNGRFTTNLYAKPLALHLYIPPSSCHTPGLVHGLIHSHLHRIMTLCTHQTDINREISSFYTHLLDRGYSPTHLFPLFLSAETKLNSLCHHTTLLPTAAPNTQRHTQTHQTTTNSIFLHLQYHPANPDTKIIQHIWHSTILNPPNKCSLTNLYNQDGNPIAINHLTVAYTLAPNLGNILSCRVLRGKIADFMNLLPAIPPLTTA